MEFLLSFLLLALNLFDYHINLNRILFLIISTAIVVWMLIIVYKREKNFLCACIVMLCHTWPVSWVNIFGDTMERIQLPWFYLFGALIVLNTIGKARILINKKVNAVMLAVFVTFVIIFVYPLIISPSKTEGLKEFIIIGFFIALVFVAFIRHDTFDEKMRRAVINAYIWVVVLSGAVIIFQSMMYLTFGLKLFKFSLGLSYGNTMFSAKVLMDDASCATIMMGSGVFFMLERFNNKEKRILYIICILITVIGLAFTSRRTSVVTLVLCFLLYVPIYYKGAMKKITMYAVLSGMVIIMMSYLVFARPVDEYSSYLDPNGRFDSFIKALVVFFQHPLGVGYDNVHLMNLIGIIVPHNTPLRWLNMGGIIFFALMMAIIFYILSIPYKKGLKDEFWLLFYCVVAMNFIPDLLSARFFVIPCMLVLLSQSKKKTGELPLKNKLLRKSL